MDRHRSAFSRFQPELTTAAPLSSAPEQRIELGMVVGPDEVEHGSTNNPLGLDSEESGETAITMQNDVVGTENRSAFVHPLNENTVCMVGSFQCEDLVPALAVHHNRVHFARANCPKGFLGLIQACNQFPA